MDLETVKEAVNKLRAEGQRPTVRGVHELTGGSFRDLSRLLAQIPVTGDEEAMGAGEASVPAQRRLGKIQEAVAAVRAAEAEISEIARVLDERRESLQVLREQFPRHAATPGDVADSVQARRDHQEKLATVAEEIEQLQRLMQARQEEALAHRREVATLQRRREELEAIFLPSARQALAKARQDHAIAERDLAHQLEMWRRRVDGQAHALSAYQRELQDLTGDPA
jgi:chromosome segregation ATPase